VGGSAVSRAGTVAFHSLGSISDVPHHGVSFNRTHRGRVPPAWRGCVGERGSRTAFPRTGGLLALWVRRRPRASDFFAPSAPSGEAVNRPGSNAASSRASDLAGLMTTTGDASPSAANRSGSRVASAQPSQPARGEHGPVRGPSTSVEAITTRIVADEFLGGGSQGRPDRHVRRSPPAGGSGCAVPMRTRGPSCLEGGHG